MFLFAQKATFLILDIFMRTRRQALLLRRFMSIKMLSYLLMCVLSFLCKTSNFLPLRCFLCAFETLSFYLLTCSLCFLCLLDLFVKVIKLPQYHHSLYYCCCHVLTLYMSTFLISVGIFLFVIHL